MDVQFLIFRILIFPNLILFIFFSLICLAGEKLVEKSRFGSLLFPLIRFNLAILFIFSLSQHLLSEQALDGSKRYSLCIIGSGIEKKKSKRKMIVLSKFRVPVAFFYFLNGVMSTSIWVFFFPGTHSQADKKEGKLVSFPL